MIWKNLSDNFLAFIFITFWLLGFPLLAFGQNNHFEALRLKFKQGAIFNADFQYQSVDSYTQDTVASTGRIWVGEQKYKVQTNNQTVVVDGQTSKVYDDDRNRLIISKYEPADDDFAPSRILNGVDSTFTVQVQQKRGDEIYILLTSDDPFALYKKVEIFLDAQLIPQKIRAVDPADNIITTTFTAGRFVAPDDDMFVLNYPESAEIVDMRN